jgi:DNA repair protein RadA/Sms
MSKSSPAFTCTACGASHAKWAGKCDACGAWNSIIEEAPLSTGPKALKSKGRTIPLGDLGTDEPPRLRHR